MARHIDSEAGIAPRIRSPDMMYSPTALGPRPRPPGALRPRRSFVAQHQHTDSSGLMGLGPYEVSDTPLHKQTSRQLPPDQRRATNDKHEVSAESTHVGDTATCGDKANGIGFPAAMSPHRPISRIFKGKGAIVQPSPPPPYGPIPPALSSQLASVSTPPTQDIETDPLESLAEAHTFDGEEEEEYLRRRRATDAAKALGLVIQRSPSMDSLGSEEEKLDEAEIRKQLRQMRHRLKSRDHELVMAAQVAENVLRQHEELVSVLPDHIKAILPQLVDFSTPHRHADEELHPHHPVKDQRGAEGSTPCRPTSTPNTAFTFGSPTAIVAPSPRSSPAAGTRKRLFRTVRSGDSSKPYPEHHRHRHARSIFSTPHQRSDSYAEVVRQEADDRLVLLERALSEARENEDAQRKVAARLRRDFDKLQREFENAERAKEVDEFGHGANTRPLSSAESMTSSQFDSWAWKQRSLEEEEIVTDGHLLRPRASRVKLRIKSKASDREIGQRRRGEELDEDTCGSNDSGWGLTRFPEFPSTDGSDPSRSRGADREDRLTRLPPRPTFSRLKAQLRYSSPTKASPARSHGHRRRTSDDDKAESCRSQASVGSQAEMQSVLEQSPGPGRHTTPMSRYGSIASHITSVGKYMSASVRSAAALGRSLGSELGSQYGDSDGEGETTFTRDTAHCRREEATRQEFEGSDTGSESQLVPIPSTASSGLSSLALALAPTSPPRIPSTRRSVKSYRSTTGSRPGSATKRPSSPTTPGMRRRRSPGRLSGSPTGRSRDIGDPGSYRPKKGRSNWLRPLLLPRAQGLKADSTRLRPGMHPRSCSDGTLALAHRRYISEVGTASAQMLKEVASARISLDSLASSATMLAVNSRGEMEKALLRGKLEGSIPRLELYSPPARLVNDLIILLSILLEWIEIFAVIVWRVTLAVKYSRKSIFATWREGRDRRYYI